VSEVTEISQESPTPPADSPRPARSWRPVWLALLAIGASAVAIPIIAALILVGPYVRDDWRLDHVVRAVALDWRDFGRDKAKERLQYELDRQGIGEQVGDDTCTFAEAKGARVIDCEWTVDIHVPGIKAAMPLSFGSTATITASGDLI
jgi:hypothetical protein